VSTGPAFVERLAVHGDDLAVLVGGEELTYRQLADRVDPVADRIGSGRRLVLVESGNDLSGLVGYLGALRGGHVVLLADRDPIRVAELVDRFAPDVVIGADGAVRELRAGSGHDLHPDLALLLATSGSTGAPRLVRLSAAALDANAAAIATYLGIAPGDRAALTLPMHYCYGLSVINSNLLGGAAVLLSDDSVLEPRFWTAFREHRATSLHGVPHTFELLDRVGFADMSLPHLRYVTQAGGRLAPDAVSRWARVGAQRGWQLVVMYGQTEATARMAYLPPELAQSRPEAIGVAIPGGSLTVEPLAGGTDPEVGELVYRGPNVMLGYAERPADLALGRTVHALHTGDLGRIGPDGLVEVVGRRSRFIKPFGVRTDLDALERLLAEHRIEAACTGTDTELVIAVPNRSAPARVRALVTEWTGLPAAMITVQRLAELPRLASGKVDYPALAAVPGRETRRRRPGTIREVLAATFPGQELTDDASFVDLGGDSLTYVRVAADVERVLGGLPPGWDHLPLGRLEATAAPTGTRRRVTLETGVLLRALAILLVVGEHAHLWAVVGGAHLMFAMSGWMFARFVLAGVPSARPRRSVRILRSATRIAVPSAIWIAFRALLHNVRFVDILLVGSLLPPLVPGYWYVDALVQILLLMALLFALPVLGRLERRHPFAFAAGLLTVALIGRLYPSAYGWWFTTDIYSTQVVLWLFVLGWMAQRATTTAQRWTTTTAILVLVPTFFGAEDALRGAIVAVGLLVLQFVPAVRVPRAVAAVATALASASLTVYLTHFGMLPLSWLGVPPAVIVAASLVVGIGAWWALTAAHRGLVRTRLRARQRQARTRDPETRPSPSICPPAASSSPSTRSARPSTPSRGSTGGSPPTTPRSAGRAA
jgi:acyl-coenzyme A synthetase/AMP-(fatty) acid ligase